MSKIKLERPLNIQVFLKGKKLLEKVFYEYPIIVGRSSKCDISLPKADFLSRQHCSVTVENAKVLVVDLESSNGIFINSERVPFAEIKEKLNFHVGDLEIHMDFNKVDIATPSNDETLLTKEQTKTKTKTKTETKTATKTSTKTKTATEVSASDKLSAGKIPDSPLVVAKAVEECPVVIEKENKSLSKPKIPTVTKPKIPAHTTTKSKKNISHENKNVNHDFAATPHAQAAQLRPQQRVLESSVTWKDQIYDVVQYQSGQAVVLGSCEESDLKVPIFKSPILLAKYDGMNTRVFIPLNVRFELNNETRKLDFDDAINNSLVSKKSNYYELKLDPSEVVTLHYTDDIAVHLRYIPAPRQLSREKGVLSDVELKNKTFITGGIHFLLFLLILLTEPRTKAPHIKNVPDRYARLLIKKPEPIVKKIPPKPKEEPKKIAQKKVEPKKPHENTRKIVKVQPRIKKIVRLQRSKVLAKVNKWPVEVSKPLKPATRPTVSNIQNVGALAALNAFSSRSQSQVPVAININKNAGGQSALNTGGVIGALKSKSGRLAAGGFASVRTKGLGYGTGTGYGVQGIKGTAGGRSIAGTVVGMPALVHFTKQEGLTREQVMSVVRQHISQIQQCYERSLIDNPKLAGRVEFEWEISPKGHVQFARVKKSDMSDGDNLNNCVVDVFKEMRFPVARNGQSTVPQIGFPFGRL